jgi:hypothetical protein
MERYSLHASLDDRFSFTVASNNKKYLYKLAEILSSHYLVDIIDKEIRNDCPIIYCNY